MASLERRGDRFRIVFRYGGQKFSRALKTASEKAALATIARLEDNLRRVELGTLAVPDDIDVPTFLLSDGQATARPSVPAIQSLGQLLDAYLASVPEGSIEESSVRCLKIHAAHFKRVLGRNLPLPSLRLPELQKYVNKRVTEKGLRGRKVCSTTVKKEMTSLSAAWNWALNAEFVQRPFPRRGLKYPKSSEKLIFHTMTEVERMIASGRLTEDEQAMLWDSAFLSVVEIEELLRTVKERDPNGAVYTMMVFAAHTGARRSEIRRCAIDDIDLEGGVVTIHERKRVRGLLTTRRVPLSPLLSGVLNRWLSRHRGWGPLFYAEDESRGNQAESFTPKGIVYQFRTAVAGTKFQHLRGWHVFRHSFCSNCTAKGIDQRILDSWVGHQTPEMSRRYRHLVPDQQREAIAAVFG